MSHSIDSLSSLATPNVDHLPSTTKPSLSHPTTVTATSCSVPSLTTTHLKDDIRLSHRNSCSQPLNLWTSNVCSPVNANGSYEFDRVVKSSQVLLRTRRTKTWKTRLLVLRPNALSFYKDAEGTQLRHRLVLSDLTAVAHQRDPRASSVECSTSSGKSPLRKSPAQHVFALFTPSRNYHVSVDCELAAQDWVDTVRFQARLFDEAPDFATVTSATTSWFPYIQNPEFNESQCRSIPDKSLANSVGQTNDSTCVKQDHLNRDVSPNGKSHNTSKGLENLHSARRLSWLARAPRARSSSTFIGGHRWSHAPSPSSWVSPNFGAPRRDSWMSDKGGAVSSRQSPLSSLAFTAAIQTSSGKVSDTQSVSSNATSGAKSSLSDVGSCSDTPSNAEHGNKWRHITSKDFRVGVMKKPTPIGDGQVKSCAKINSDERVVYQGWLRMLRNKGGVRQWKTVWAVLRPKAFALYKTAEEYTALYVLPLKTTVVDAVETDPPSRRDYCCFQIICDERGRNYRFATVDDEALARWLGAFKSLLMERRVNQFQSVSSVVLGANEASGKDVSTRSGALDNNRKHDGTRLCGTSVGNMLYSALPKATEVGS